MTTSVYLRQHVIPAAYALLPPRMASREATAMLLAIAMQESRCDARRQIRGPARSWYQFERRGLAGVMTHAASAGPLHAAQIALRYPTDDLEMLYAAVEHNDVLATVCARLLLWTLPQAMPGPVDTEAGWQAYIDAWRPGKPRRASWDMYFAESWSRV